MPDTPPDTPPEPAGEPNLLGAALRTARGTRSIRAAARAAGISEGRWRQVEAGHLSVGNGVSVPVQPKAVTVVAMARAVGIDPARALALAGYDPAGYDHLLPAADAFATALAELAAAIARVQALLEAMGPQG